MSISKGSINRAGEALRIWRVSDEQLEPPDEAFDLVSTFRQHHIDPMLAVTRMVIAALESASSSQVLISNRLKRMPQIIDKLARFPKTNLARMEDIGGCRAVLLGGGPELLSVTYELTQLMEVVRVRDYVNEPKSTGYRGIHVVAQIQEHRIEVQLRTLGQQGWASTVERLAGRLSTNLKDGVGPEPVTNYLRLAGSAVATLEGGGRLEAPDSTELDRARTDVLTLLEAEVA